MVKIDSKLTSTPFDRFPVEGLKGSESLGEVQPEIEMHEVASVPAIPVKAVKTEEMVNDLQGMCDFADFLNDAEFKEVYGKAAEVINKLAETKPEFLADLEDTRSVLSSSADSVKEILSPELFPTLDSGLKYAGNFSLLMTLVNASMGSKEVSKINTELGECKEKLAVLEKQELEGDNTEGLKLSIANIKNKIKELESNRSDALKNAALTLLQNVVMVSGRDISHFSQLLALIGAGTKLAIAGGALGLVGGGMYAALSTADLIEQSRGRTEINNEIDFLEKTLKDPANANPLVQRIIKLRHNALVEQFEVNSVDSVRSSLWVTSSTMGAASSVGLGLVALGVAFPPAGAAVVTVGALTAAFLTLGLLASGAGRSAFQNREVIKATGQRMVQWSKNKMMEIQSQAAIKKYEQLERSIGTLKDRISEISLTAQTEINAMNPRITELLELISEFDSQGITLEPQETTKELSGILDFIKGRIQSHKSEAEKLFEVISKGEKDPDKLRAKLKELSTTLFALQENQSKFQSKLSLSTAKDELANLRSKISGYHKELHKEVKKYQKMLVKINECTESINQLAVDKEKGVAVQAEIKQKVQDLSQSGQMGMPLEEYLGYKKEFTDLLKDTANLDAVIGFLHDQHVDCSEIESKPAEVILSYIVRKGWMHEQNT